MATTDTNTQDGIERWRDGGLKATRIETNGFPEGHDEADVPDELFLETPSGRVEVCRDMAGVHPTRYVWRVYDGMHSEDGQTFEDFEDAFAHALLLVRREVEGQ